MNNQIDFKDFGYIFVVTYARSGSTLIQSLLNSLDGVQVRGENNNALFHLYQAISGITEAKKHGRWDRQSEPDEPWYGAAQMKPIGFRNTLLNTYVKNVLCPDDGALVLGTKEIRYTPFFMSDVAFTGYMDFLLETFPKSRIVFNTRNAEDVSKSAWLAQTDPNTRSWVKKCDERFHQYNIASDRTILMHYDDYVADHSEIQSLFKFLGYDYDAQQVDEIFSKPLNHAK